MQDYICTGGMKRRWGGWVVLQHLLPRYKWHKEKVLKEKQILTKATIRIDMNAPFRGLWSSYFKKDGALFQLSKIGGFLSVWGYVRRLLSVLHFEVVLALAKQH